MTSSNNNIIDGKAFAAGLVKDITAAVAKLDVQPGLAVVQLGDHPASRVYVQNKIRKTEVAGMRSLEYHLPETTSQAALLDKIATLNADDSVDGILVQLPLPKAIDSSLVIDAISPDKDVDGFHIVNVGRLATGLPSLVPCTPYGCLLLLQHAAKKLGGDLSGLEAVIVGRSNIVGKPMAQLLLGANCSVTIVHSKTRDLPKVCSRADILVAAVGKPEMVKGDWIKKGAVVIDVGINRLAGDEKTGGKSRLVGDVAFHEAAKKAAAITPVPGGVGPMTIACLLHNTLLAATRRRGLDTGDILSYTNRMKV
ncbi:MAG: bifunctional methylenetetrahydrofolate dehydrogenase/methenyltetrahydrofolate cyclohydrolase FolD [Proteobacteria bacterium]|nr:bifunctional methylenetetrahydrofolate dehydrogenase/methenyltetrahydrofolate cyclohydrolase FolD [Pseudomonadota bacterium]